MDRGFEKVGSGPLWFYAVQDERIIMVIYLFIYSRG